jgi:hypothetical protein
MRSLSELYLRGAPQATSRLPGSIAKVAPGARGSRSSFERRLVLDSAAAATGVSPLQFGQQRLVKPSPGLKPMPSASLAEKNVMISGLRQVCFTVLGTTRSSPSPNVGSVVSGSSCKSASLPTQSSSFASLKLTQSGRPGNAAAALAASSEVRLKAPARRSQINHLSVAVKGCHMSSRQAFSAIARIPPFHIRGERLNTRFSQTQRPHES